MDEQWVPDLEESAWAVLMYNMENSCDIMYISQLVWRV
jgi:hypothetical protein